MNGSSAPIGSGSPLEGALDMARRGFKVHRVYGVDGDFSAEDEYGAPTDCVPACRCKKGINCPSIGKHPDVGDDWRSKSTTDEAQIRAWWDEKPHCNFGVNTDGLIVADIDYKKKGAAHAFDEIKDALPP